MTSSISKMSTEAFLAQQVWTWHNTPEEERDLVARNFLCGLVLYIERAEKMIPILARAHLKNLYAKWRQFNDWVNYVDDDYSAHYKEWIR